MKNCIGAALLAFVLISVSGRVTAETQEVRFAKQTSMGYVQFNILERHKLLEKHAKALGLGEVKATWVTFSGPDAMNTALLAGDVDVVAGGVPALVIIWAKTRGTPQEVRGISALSSQPFLLNTRNPKVKTIRDFTDAVASRCPPWGISAGSDAAHGRCASVRQGKLHQADPLTVALPPPDATIGLPSGGSAFDSVFSVPPFQTQQLRDPAVHTVLSSFEVLGGSHSSLLPGRRASSTTRIRSSIVRCGGTCRSNGNAQRGQARGGDVVDGRFQVQTPARPRVRRHRRSAGQMDPRTGEHDEIRVVHVRRRHRESDADDMEGTVLPGNP